MFNNTPLHIACEKNLSLFVKLFLYHQNIDVNIQNNDIQIIYFEIVFIYSYFLNI